MSYSGFCLAGRFGIHANQFLKWPVFAFSSLPNELSNSARPMQMLAFLAVGFLKLAVFEQFAHIRKFQTDWQHPLEEILV